MKYQRLKKWVTIRISLYLSILIIMATCYFILGIQEGNLTKEKNDKQAEVSFLSKKVAALEAKKTEIIESTKIWNQLPERQKKIGDGLRLDAIKNLLSDYADRYQIHELSINFSTPNELPEPYKTDSAVIESSKISLTFSSINDENILSFIETILRDAPGYVTVNYFKLTRQASISPALLEDIRKGVVPKLVSAELSLQWNNSKINSAPESASQKNKNTKKGVK